MLSAAIKASARRTARTRRPDTTHSSTASCSASACVDECAIHDLQPCLLVCVCAALAVSCTLVIAAGVPASTLSLRLQLPRMIVCKRACDTSSYVPSNSSKSPLVRFYYPTSSCSGSYACVSPCLQAGWAEKQSSQKDRGGRMQDKGLKVNGKVCRTIIHSLYHQLLPRLVLINLVQATGAIPCRSIVQSHVTQIVLPV